MICFISLYFYFHIHFPLTTRISNLKSKGNLQFTISSDMVLVQVRANGEKEFKPFQVFYNSYVFPTKADIYSYPKGNKNQP